MKNLWEKFNEKRLKAFTLLEMLVVLLIIGVLILLFVPNLTKQKENINKSGDQAIEKIVETQMELYFLDTGKSATLQELLTNNYITDDQFNRYEALPAKPSTD